MITSPTWMPTRSNTAAPALDCAAARSRAWSCSANFHGLGRLGEHEEERVAGGADLLALRVELERLTDGGVVRLDAVEPVGVAEALLDARRADDVGEEQGQHPDPVLALERLNLRAVLENALEIGRGHAACADTGAGAGKQEIAYVPAGDSRRPVVLRRLAVLERVVAERDRRAGGDVERDLALARQWV
jgi:hypothetical protein